MATRFAYIMAELLPRPFWVSLMEILSQVPLQVPTTRFTFGLLQMVPPQTKDLEPAIMVRSCFIFSINCSVSSRVGQCCEGRSGWGVDRRRGFKRLK